MTVVLIFRISDSIALCHALVCPHHQNLSRVFPGNSLSNIWFKAKTNKKNPKLQTQQTSFLILHISHMFVYIYIYLNMLQVKKKVYGTLENTSLVYEVYQTTDV